MSSRKAAPTPTARPGDGPLWVWIYLPGRGDPVLCGRFERTLTGASAVGSFTYGKRYLALPERLPVDPVALPLLPKRFETAALSGWFPVLLDAGPDAWGRRLIDRAIGPQDERGYLLNSHGQTVGALAFSASQLTPPPSAHSATPSTFEYTLSLHARVDAGESLSPSESAKLMGDAGSGGARPKLTLEEGGSLWLAKGISINDSAQFSPVPCVEGALLTLAEDCDIRVPRHDVCRIAGNPVLLVERFDRYRLADGRFGRWRYASAQTLFWSRPDIAQYSYQGSYTNLARHLRVWGRTPADDVRALYHRVVFNALVGNTDDHDKNHGVVANADDDFVLAPAFDLTISDRLGERDYLAMAFGDAGGEITLENLLSNCEVFGYTRPQALDVIHAQWSVLSSRLVETLVRYGSPDDKASRTAMRIPGYRLLGAP